MERVLLYGGVFLLSLILLCKASDEAVPTQPPHPAGYSEDEWVKKVYEPIPNWEPDYFSKYREKAKPLIYVISHKRYYSYSLDRLYHWVPEEKTWKTFGR